ncbi:MAG: pyridoxamine 5'-phosphate oxidase family protein [Alphaproteobacteria bacterium]|jgi:hypothetical protein|nr:pyridoxamine 5'-phosphate oxidase family protein [Alphaproteobacteria bacterium]MDP6516615.1 pyridoxamine 5'-phosphate oxidase family protein [Alphaproteobacteria bacterium]
MTENDSSAVASIDDLRALHDPPTERVIAKQLSKLDTYCKRFIALSPFLCISTHDSDGNADVSPRGDAPGFVRVIDDSTLIVPDRRGNNRLDTLANIVDQPSVGLLFLVPGINETLRINGTAEVVRDQAILAAAETNGIRPKVAVRVTVREAFLHCGKAMIRSHLWDPERHVSRDILPGLGQMIAEQIAGAPIDAEVAAAADARIEESYKTRLY